MALTSLAQSTMLAAKLCGRRGILFYLPSISNLCQVETTRHFHQTSSALMPYQRPFGPKKWLKHNEKVYPPQSPDEERRPAFVCHQVTHVKYSPWKLWYCAAFVRGMTVDEALKQLSFVSQKGAEFVKQGILEAQQLAVEKHNVEFPSNLWIAESNAGKGPVVKGIRRHARMRFGKIQYYYSHYFIRLEEGRPPKDLNFWTKNTLTEQKAAKLLEDWVKEMRQRRIPGSL